VELAGGDPVARGRDPLGLLLVEQAELGVHARGGSFDPAEPAGDVHGDRLAGYLEVFDRLLRLVTPELVHEASVSRRVAPIRDASWRVADRRRGSGEPGGSPSDRRVESSRRRHTPIQNSPLCSRWGGGW